MIRCDWVMPENEIIKAGGRCVKYADHGKVHVIAAVGGSAVTFWRVKPRKRTIQAIMHVDLRSNASFNDDECLALYHSFIASRRAR